MRQRLVTVATFSTPEEAGLARIKLDAVGIDTYVNDAAVVGNLWTYGNAVGGVKLQVAEDDAERAGRILSAARHPQRVFGSPWKCAKCGQSVEPDFDVCWKCGALCDGTDDPTFKADIEADDSNEDQDTDDDEAPKACETDFPTPSSTSTGNPYASPLAESEPMDEEFITDTTEGDAAVARAFRAAILGLVVCPPALSIYSAILLTILALAGHTLSPRGNRQYRWAWILNGVGWGFGMLILRFWTF